MRRFFNIPICSQVDALKILECKEFRWDCPAQKIRVDLDILQISHIVSMTLRDRTCQVVDSQAQISQERQMSQLLWERSGQFLSTCGDRKRNNQYECQFEYV